VKVRDTGSSEFKGELKNKFDIYKGFSVTLYVPISVECSLGSSLKEEMMTRIPIVRMINRAMTA
jgi:hypothetical protein